MKIECVKEKITRAISQVEKVTGKNLTLQVLGCVLLEADKNNLIVRATNLDLGVELQIPTKVIEPGRVAVSASVLNNLLSNIPGDKSIVFETTDTNTLKVTSLKTSTIIKTMPHDDFPNIPRVAEEQAVKINSGDFVKGLKSVWYAASVSSVKPELSSVYVAASDDDHLIFAATDSFRLAEKRIRFKKGDLNDHLLIPFKNIPEIIRLLSDVNDEITIFVTKNQISFSHPSLYLTSRVIDGVFPDYKQIIPASAATEATVLKQDLVQAIKVANIFSDKFNQVNVSVAPSKKSFEIKTTNADVGESVNKIDAVLTGEDVTVNFNHKYITDSFQSFEADSLSLSFNSINRPLVIRGVGDKSFLYLVMPMNR